MFLKALHRVVWVKFATLGSCAVLNEIPTNVCPHPNHTPQNL